MLDINQFLTNQRLRLLIFFSVIGLLGFGYYLQYVEGLEPCALCITQRFFLFTCGITGLLAALHNPALLGSRIYAVIGALLAFTGSGFSSRQLYLQGLPPGEAPACGPSIDFIFDTFPLTEALSILLRGDGNCAEVAWQFLGLSIPGWTFIVFIGLGVLWLLQLRASKTT